ncbi:oncoprotein-induced transcript 3 protein-like isoform X1 [Ostrea edulis]|uniref:oncoprotein-induced transcript 3 protein-like isoform X1 n=1 Tax=Ostrea edulis TaxID=37623 RepID=UPI0024AED8C1|nr:oncoprotein-induced transcript 3 protein-like isoform X1 [Ostrea edulis]
MAMLSLLIVVLICNISEAAYYCNVADPCAHANASTFFEPYARFEICQYDSKYGLCDRYITPDWYRVEDAMLTECPNLLSCGALYPVWLNGSLPTEAEGIVDAKVCKVGFADCCSRNYDVKIRNCGSFYAYCLGALDSCSERYCFGEQGSCEVPTTTPTMTTTASPTTYSEEDDDHRHINLEIRLGAIFGVLVLIFVTMCIIYRKDITCMKCCRRGNKLGSTEDFTRKGGFEKQDIQNSAHSRENARCWSPPPPYSH